MASLLAFKDPAIFLSQVYSFSYFHYNSQIKYAMLIYSTHSMEGYVVPSFDEYFLIDEDAVEYDKG